MNACEFYLKAFVFVDLAAYNGLLGTLTRGIREY